MVVVSHDRRFLDKIVQKLIVFTRDGRIRIFAGNYADYLWKIKQEQQDAAAVKEKAAAVANNRKPEATRAVDGEVPLSKNEINRRRRKISGIEGTVLNLEKAKEEILAEMGSLTLDNERRRELAHRLPEIDAELETAFADWEKWSLEIEKGYADPTS